MTYHTPEGDYTFIGHEALLLRRALESAENMLFHDEEGVEPYEYGIGVFDRLQPGQKLALLVEVGESLLVEEAPAPDLTAAVEATVAVLLDQLKLLVQLEVDDPDGFANFDGPTTRELLLMVAADPELHGDDFQPPEADSRDMEEWEFLVDCFGDFILFDADFEDEHLYMDDPPEMSGLLKTVMRIDDDYFTAIPRDPGEAECIELRRRLARLFPA